jgi:fatty acid desaturase
VGKRALEVRVTRALAAIYTALSVASIAMQTTILLWVRLAPVIIGRAFLLAENSGCGHSRHVFEKTRTTFNSGLVRWFTWNMTYHADHHAHVNIPFHALQAWHAVVEGRLIHRGARYGAVTGEVWRWFRQRQAWVTLRWPVCLGGRT